MAAVVKLSPSFLTTKTAADGAAGLIDISVVLNWLEELKRLAPTKRAQRRWRPASCSALASVVVRSNPSTSHSHALLAVDELVPDGFELLVPCPDWWSSACRSFAKQDDAVGGDSVRPRHVTSERRQVDSFAVSA